MKKVLIGLGALVVIIAVGVYIFLGSLDDIVKAAVEKVGSDLTQTDVRLDEVDIELTSGKGTLRGFRVTNPQGFSDDDAFRFDEISATLDLTTVQSDPVVVKEIVIDGPVVVYEFAEDGGSNLGTLNSSVQSGTAGSGDSTDGDSASRNIVIENLYLRNGSVAVRAPLLDEPMSLPMPPVHLTDIGKDGKGATPDEIAEQVMASVFAAARDAVAKANVDIDALTGEAREALENVGAGMSSMSKDAEEGVKGMLEGLGGK